MKSLHSTNESNFYTPPFVGLSLPYWIVLSFNSAGHVIAQSVHIHLSKASLSNSMIALFARDNTTQYPLFGCCGYQQGQPLATLIRPTSYGRRSNRRMTRIQASSASSAMSSPATHMTQGVHTTLQSSSDATTHTPAIKHEQHVSRAKGKRPRNLPPEVPEASSAVQPTPQTPLQTSPNPTTALKNRQLLPPL